MDHENSLVDIEVSSVPALKRAKANLILGRNEDAVALVDGEVVPEYYVDANEDVVAILSSEESTVSSMEALPTYSSSPDNYCPDEWVDYR